MKEKLNQFVSNLNGQFVEVSDKSNIYQCMDLAYLWTFCLDFPKATIQRLHAYKVYTEPTALIKQYFDLIPNTPEAIPEDGDLVVWGSEYGPAGHIGIALSGGTVNSFRVFEQNNPLGTNAHIQSRSYAKILGWLRPKQPTVSDIVAKIDLGEIGGVKYGIVELQALKSMLLAKDIRIKELEAQPSGAPVSFSNPLANLFYLIAQAIQGKD